MIIMHLTGGLGNQLFQYALGRQLALKNATKLYLDIFGFETYKLHSYSLQYFNLASSLATRTDVAKLKFYNLFKSSKPYYKRSIIQEQDFSFDPNIINVSDNVYLKGYWQSEKYFKEVENAVRKEITLKNRQNPKYHDMLNKISDSNSVSLHIRRADYLSSKSKAVFTVCTPDYYKRAVTTIADQTNTPKLFVFSDDIEWVKQNIKLPFPVEFVSDSTVCADYNYQELMLMSACKHNITANSTFSWWGAWLNNNPEKIVVTPKQWFLDPNRNDSDLIPLTWIRL